MSMTKTLLLVLGALLVATPVTPASGQSLSESIQIVKKRRADQARKDRVAGRQTKMLQRLFYTELDVDFEKVPVRDVFEFMDELLDVQLIVRYHDDPTGIGIDPDTAISLEGEALLAVEVIEMVLEQCSVIDDCTWQLRRSFIEIGPKERLGVSSAQEMRIYPIDELLYEAPRFSNRPVMGFNVGYPGWIGAYDSDYSHRGRLRYTNGWGWGWGSRLQGQGYGGAFGGNVVSNGTTKDPDAGDRGNLNSREAKAERAEELIEFITSMVEPEAWNRNGGMSASIEYRDGSLFVRAPEFVHREIAGYPPIPPPEDVLGDEGEAGE